MISVSISMSIESEEASDNAFARLFGNCDANDDVSKGLVR